MMIYPGDAWCNPSQYAHAKWHHESAVGLLDLIYTCDNVHRLTLQSTSPPTQSSTANLPSTTTVENPPTSAAKENLNTTGRLYCHSIMFCIFGFIFSLWINIEL